MSDPAIKSIELHVAEPWVLAKISKAGTAETNDLDGSCYLPRQDDI